MNRAEMLEVVREVLTKDFKRVLLEVLAEHERSKRTPKRGRRRSALAAVNDLDRARAREVLARKGLIPRGRNA